MAPCYEQCLQARCSFLYQSVSQTIKRCFRLQSRQNIQNIQHISSQRQRAGIPNRRRARNICGTTQMTADWVFDDGMFQESRPLLAERVEPAIWGEEEWIPRMIPICRATSGRGSADHPILLLGNLERGQGKIGKTLLWWGPIFPSFLLKRNPNRGILCM